MLLHRLKTANSILTTRFLITCLQIVSPIHHSHKNQLLSSLRIRKPYNGISTGETFRGRQPTVPTQRHKWPPLLSSIDHVVRYMDIGQHTNPIPRPHEFLPRGTVADFLYSNRNRGDEKRGIEPRTPLTWEDRLKICIGAAKELNSLHNGTTRVIHGDVKSSNILLNENFVAKVSGLQVPKLTPQQRMIMSRFGNKVRGTPGYLDPVYMSTMRLTCKSDVYSFGVVMLEILCGRPAVDLNLPTDQQHLTTWAKPWLETDNESSIREISDGSVVKEINWASLQPYVKLVLHCLHDDHHQRPTMSDVVEQLQNALYLQQSNGSTSL